MPTRDLSVSRAGEVSYSGGCPGRFRRYAEGVNRVLVLGVPRGGTTWVGQTLGRTAGSVYVHEPDGTSDPFAFRAKYSLLHHPILDPGDRVPGLERLWEGAFSGGGRPGGLRGRLAQRAYREVTGVQKIRARQQGRFTPRLRVAYLAAVPRVAVDTEHVVVKSVNAALCADWIAGRWNPRVVVVSRDPRNVMASWLSFGWNAPQGPMYEAFTSLAARRWGVVLPALDAPPIDRATAACATLMVALRESLRDHPEWLHLAHEDLCSDPHGAFKAAAAALGLEWTEQASRFLDDSNRPGDGYATRRIASEQSERWRARLGAEEVRTISSVLDRFPEELWTTSPATR